MNFLRIVRQIIETGIVVADDGQIYSDRELRVWIQAALAVLLAGLVVPLLGIHWLNVIVGLAFPPVAFMLLVRRVPQTILLAIGLASERVAELERFVLGWLGVWAMFGLVPILVPIQYSPTAVPVAVVALVGVTLIGVERGGGDRLLKVLYGLGITVLVGCVVAAFWARHAAIEEATPGLAPQHLVRYDIVPAWCRSALLAPPAGAEEFEIAVPARCNRVCIARPGDAPYLSVKPRGGPAPTFRFGGREVPAVGRFARPADEVCFRTGELRQLVEVSFVRPASDLP